MSLSLCPSIVPKGATTRVCSTDDVHQCAGIDVRAKERKDWLHLEIKSWRNLLLNISKSSNQ